ncbi:MAG TPA: ATP-binding cassette domain-containing protein [Candidatus Limnocylindrales bacterium]|nr:ATP-binding cassette domain-containing protein [Candidatus Limnocylindrales bacterium]
MTAVPDASARDGRLPRDRGRLVQVGVVGGLIAYLAATFAVANGSFFIQNLLMTAAIFGILAISLDLVAGMTGLYSLGHAGLFAIGAYSMTLLNDEFGIPVLVLLPVCFVEVGLVGAFLGALSLRVSGLYFAITTFIFTLVVTVILVDFEFTGGLGGLGGPTFPDFPAGLDVLGDSLVWAVAIIFLLCVGAVWCIRASALYPVLLAIRDAEPYAAAAGVRTATVRIAVFALSAGMAGLAGAAFSFLGFISPGQFNWTVSVTILVMVILGGMNTHLGPILGAAFISMFPILVPIDPFVEQLLYGAIFVLVIVFYPTGFVGLIQAIWRRLRPRRLPGVRAAQDEEAAIDDDIEAVPAAPAEAAQSGLALECRDIVFGYDEGSLALAGVSLAVRHGTIHGLIGPNGSGKSTLVNIIAGRLAPRSGSVTVNGQVVDGLGAAARPSHGLMRTFQSAVMVREISALANTTIGLYSRVPRMALRAIAWPLLPSGRRDSRVMNAQASATLNAVGLDPAWHRTRVADVPHGVEQLTQLAASIVASPSVLILDEPLAGLAAGEVDHVSRIVRDLRRKGVTVIVVEHQTRFIFDVCDEVTVLAAGEVVRSGPAAAVRSDDRVREVYLGQ